MLYRLYLTSYGDTSIALGSGPMGDTSSKTFPLNSLHSVTDSTLCGVGTLKAHIIPDGQMPATYPARNYVDTITMVLTPQ